MVARQRIAGKAGLVVVFDGDGDAVAQALVAGVVAAHDALQLGELADHVGQQVALGEPGGFLDLAVEHLELVVGLDRVGQRRHAELMHDRMGKRRDPLGALTLRAQLAVVDHLGQAGQAVFELFLAVLVVEELGVGEARAHDPLIALDDGAGVGRRDIADDEEVARQFARRIQQREILLVGLHRQDQALLRHGQELGLEGAGQHIGALDQRGHFVQQGLVIDGREAEHIGRGLELARDLGTAVGEAGDDGALLSQLRGVAVGGFDADRGLRRLEAVALGRAAGGQAQGPDRHDLRAMQRDEAVRRTHKLHVGPAIGELVGHDLGDGQLGQRFVQRLLQALGERGAGLHAVPEQRLGLAVRQALELRHDLGSGADRGELLQQCGCGLAVRSQRHGDGHQLLLHGPVGRLVRDPGDMHAQAARRGE
mmetsp:Transcript_5838/g.22820  ORF Transcript_5838/g.22820 Transcript_5838/m.22820 type:complete len:424 (+) Transcript_5838:342-1613(+)